MKFIAWICHIQITKLIREKGVDVYTQEVLDDILFNFNHYSVLIM